MGQSRVPADNMALLQESIIGRMDLSRQMSEEEVRELIDEEISKEGKARHLTLDTKATLRKEIYHTIRELGILQDLIDDPEITEIMVNGTTPIFVEKEGKISQLSVSFESEEKLNHVIQQIVSRCNRVINEASPIVDARLKDGSRVSAVLTPIALNGPILTIRRFPREAITMEQLVSMNSITQEAAEILKKMGQAGSNILVRGGTGSGKTTFLNVLSGCIPETERVITIEDSAELQLQNLPNLVRLETRNANVDGCREITIRDLIKASLRMRPSRLIVGEVRGKEAVDMLQSVNVGHYGMTTVHANSVRDVVSRLETMVLMGMDLPLNAIRKQIVSGFDLMIHLGRLRDGSRRVLEIAEPLSVAGEEVQIQTLFRFFETGVDKRGRVSGELKKMGELKYEEKLKAAGISI